MQFGLNFDQCLC